MNTTKEIPAKGLFIFTPRADWDRNQNIEVFEKMVREEYKAGCGNFNGYRFVFCEDVHATHKRACPAMFITCSELVRNAVEKRNRIRAFRNMNGELACQLIEGIAPTPHPAAHAGGE